jgi:hypothetical protein
MEYVHQRGAFDDMPLAQIVSDFQRTYPAWLAAGGGLGGASFQDDVERELR